MDEFKDFSWCLRPSGVYLLLLRGTVVYVGKSKNVASRLAEHYRSLVRYRKGKPNRPAQPWLDVVLFDQAKVKFCLEEDLDREEIVLIQRYLPQYNKLMKRPPPRPGFENLPAIADLIRRGRNRETPLKIRSLRAS
jgi:excinuclease UvrABC nuclease subunit